MKPAITKRGAFGHNRLYIVRYFAERDYAGRCWYREKIFYFLSDARAFVKTIRS